MTEFRPHVVCTIPGLGVDAGGPTRTVPAFCSALADAGIGVDLITVGGGEARFGANMTPGHKGISVLEVPGVSVPFMNQRLAAGFGGMVHSRLLAASDTVLHDNGCWTPSNYMSAAAARRAGRPSVITIRGMLSPWALSHRRFKKRAAWHLYQRRVLDSASLLHATSDQEAEDLQRLGLRGPIAVIPNGIALPGENGPAHQRHCRASSRPRKVLFLSRIHPKKGLSDLVWAWARVRPANWRVVVAGPDEQGHQAEIERLATELGVREHFDFVGPLNDDQKWTAYGEADLFVLPTHSENFGVVVGEAMAMGLPVITTRRAPWKMIEEAQCGWWIEDTIDGLAAALSQATALPPNRMAEMGERARQVLAAQVPTWDTVAATFLEVYLWLVGRGSRPPCIR